MKKVILVALIATSTVLLSSCGSEAPLTEAEQAKKYNMTTEVFQETKEAAARMNMTMEDHMKMTDTSKPMDHSTMDMSDDSDMIEDDMDMMKKDENADHMDTMHTGKEVESHPESEHK